MSNHAEHLEYAFTNWKTFIYLLKYGYMEEDCPEVEVLLALAED